MNLTQDRYQKFANPTPRAARGVRCPDCGDQTYRVSRRFIDHLLCLVMDVRRYRCLSPDCQWEGNLHK